MIKEELRQQIRDEEHLKLLSLGYMVSAGISAFYSLFGIFYMLTDIMFIFTLSDPLGRSGADVPPAFIGWVFGGMGLAFLVFGLTLAVLKWRASRCLKQRRSLVFCQVVAALSCFEIPYGTFWE